MTDQQVELLQDLMFNTVPGDLAGAEDALRADTKAAHAKANKAAKAADGPGDFLPRFMNAICDMCADSGPVRIEMKEV